MIQNISYKDFFKRYGIFVAFLVVIFGLLIYTVKISQKSWVKNLKTTVEAVLDEVEPNSWTFESNIELKNPFVMNAACYEVRNRKNGELYKVFIIRVQTLYGPLPAVFTMDKNNKVEFIGYASLHGYVEAQLMENKTNRRIDYWIQKIPTIINEKNESGDNNE